MAEQATFSSRTVIVLIAIGFLAFVGATYFMIYEDTSGFHRAGTNAYSHSAIGHKAFVDILRRLEVPVIVSRDNSAEKADHSALIVIAEPRLSLLEDEAIEELLSAGTALLVLPKWNGRADRYNPGWADRVRPVSSARVEDILKRVATDGKIAHGGDEISWQPGPLGIVPTLSKPQLMKTTQLEPILASDQGMLIGELIHDNHRIWVLSDPDILSNHGIDDGDNAALTLAMIDELRSPDGAVIVDESIHGFRQRSNSWGPILELPFVVATILSLAAIIALMWAATERFGSPIAARRPTEAGKAGLIDNTASLLERSGYGAAILRRYLLVTLRDVGRRLHAPRRLDEAALIDWVDRVGEARGVKQRYGVIRRQAEAIAGSGGADSARLARAAQDLYRWKQEIVNGS
jgi:hypothetical protein